MELLLHYIWKHRLYPLHQLLTNGGEAVEVVDPGLHNRNAGPDFFNAKIKIGGVMWVGNVEIHDKASDWFLHGHDRDEAYDSVILHVVGTDDMPVTNSRGETLRQMQMDVPDHVRGNFNALQAEDRFPPCHKIVPALSTLMLHSWMSALQTERLEAKTNAIMRRVEQHVGSWEDAFFATLARNFGFGVNGEAFEDWGSVLSLQSIAHHRDDIFQIEAMFLGQAGLLDPLSVADRHRDAMEADDYYRRLAAEYKYLDHKFSLPRMDGRKWKFMRLRPQNFPYIRIAQLANLYYSRQVSLSNVIERETAEELRSMFGVGVTPYWQTHYIFGRESKKVDKRLSARSVELILLNTVVPILFAYGRYRGDERLCDRAFSLLEQLKAEDNSIVRMWRECGMEIGNAADSQAMVQLSREYCDRRECLRCRIGYEYIRLNGWFAKDE